MVPAGFDSRQRPFILAPGSHGYREERKDMKKKSSYIAVQVTENGKNYAYAVKVSESDNLLSKLEIKGITAANLCGSRKEAEEVVTDWNEAFKNNGSYMFGEVFC
jgi:hypothetical protein|uniref:Uncharacterized protein n=1 Tax=Siphoviridae sp. ctEJG5 TaxID=2827814 RepID=A0A8S5RXP9_9CAUD|nr:MAG TPA: hypothetical protein [Siphoviridae sp. ctEJG5]